MESLDQDSKKSSATIKSMWKKAFKSLKSTSDTKLVSRRPQYYLSQCEISLSTSPHRAKSLTALHKAKYLSQLLYIGPNISINYLKQGKISLTSDTSSGCYILVKFLTQGKISLSSNINKPVSQGPQNYLTQDEIAVSLVSH